MAVKERTLTQEIAWRLAEVYAAQTHGNYDEETLFRRGGDWAADEVGEVLSERLGVPTEALEAGVVWEMVKALKTLVRQVSCAHHLIIEACGATNASILDQCLEQAKAVLARVRGEAS